MTVTIDGSRTKLIIVDDAAKADTAISADNEDVIFHLTKGFDGTNMPTDPAFTAAAHAPFSAGPRDRISDWTFGFIQIERVNNSGYFYAGRTLDEGSISVQAHLAPALPKAVLADKKKESPAPWYTDPSVGTSIVAPLIHTSMSDHPAFKIPTKLKNSLKSNIDNFLFHVVDDLEFWTILSSLDPDGTFRHHVHFHWKVRHDVKFTWRDGRPQVAGKSSSFQILEQNVAGPPTEAEVANVLAAPAAPFANDAQGDALLKSFFGARGTNRIENPKRFSNVPPSFWI